MSNTINLREIYNAKHISRELADELIAMMPDPEFDGDCVSSVIDVDGNGHDFITLCYEFICDREAYRNAELDHAFDYDRPSLYADGREIRIINNDL